MDESELDPPLKPLHATETLLKLKIEQFALISTDSIVASLAPGEEHSLKARSDGTILDGHHRIFVLSSRGVNVDSLPREIVVRE
jgi:hypothetical protein